MTDKVAVGTLFLCSKTERILLNMRAPNKTHNLTWSLWGGMMEKDKDKIPKDTLFRELTEEMGFVPEIEKIYPFDIYESADKHFRYYSFVCVVDDEFVPVLNEESAGYAWTNLGIWPRPMHKGAASSFCKKKSLDKLRMILDQHQ